MRKYVVLITAVFLVTTVYGVTTLTLGIKDSQVQYVVAMVNAVLDSHISIHVQGSQNAADPNIPDYILDVDVQFQPDPNDPNETNTQKVRRLLTSITYEMSLAHHRKLKQAEVDAVKAAIEPNDVEMDTDIFE